jgi:DNA-binding PadR family transcriptional regulator
MPIADLTDLQFLVLEIIGPSKRPGREVREAMEAQGVRKGLAAFYQLMSRLEDSEFVEGSYEVREVDGYTVKERIYKLSGKDGR